MGVTYGVVDDLSAFWYLGLRLCVPHAVFEGIDGITDIDRLVLPRVERDATPEAPTPLPLSSLDHKRDRNNSDN